MSYRPSSSSCIFAHAFMPRREFTSPFTGLISWRIRVELPHAPALPRRGAFAMGIPPRVHSFPVFRLLCPFRLSPMASSFRKAFPPHYFPLLLTSIEESPVFGMEDSNGMMEVACCWLPHPRSAAPQSPYRVGQVDLYGRCNAEHCSGPSSCLVPTISGVTGWHHRQGMPGSRFPEGLCTLLVHHHVIPQPSTTS